MGTDTWGAFFGFCGDHSDRLASRNITVKNCHFKDIWVRVQGVFPGCSVHRQPLRLVRGRLREGPDQCRWVNSAMPKIRDNMFLHCQRDWQNRRGLRRHIHRQHHRRGQHARSGQCHRHHTPNRRTTTWQEVHPVTQGDKRHKRNPQRIRRHPHRDHAPGGPRVPLLPTAKAFTYRRRRGATEITRPMSAT